MLVSLASILLNYFAASRMSAWFGFSGLALSTSIVALFGALVLFGLLRNRISGVYGRDLASSIVRIIAASAAMGAVVYGSDALILGRLGAGRIAHLTDLLISVPLGVAVFYSGCRLLRVRELEVATRGMPISFSVSISRR